MKRSTLALALCIGLCACSGQTNKDTNRGLGSGERDAAPDADEVEPAEDGEVPAEEDASPSDEDGGADTSDAGSSEAGSTDAGGGEDGGLDASTSDAGDAGGDAGGNDGTKLRVKVPFYGLPSGIPVPGFQPAVVFSLADGGVESVQQVDDAGMVVSDTAPASLTAMLWSRSTSLNDVTLLVTVMAPALGDFIELSTPPERNGEEQQTDVFLVSTSGAPNNTYAIDFHAGVGGCAQGYLGLMPAPTAPARVGKYSNCELENPGSLIAVARDIDDRLLGYGATTLPTTSTFPASVSVDQWLTPETLTLSLIGVQPNTTPQTRLWLRKGLLRLQIDTPDSPPPDQVPFSIARSIADSFDVGAILDRTRDSGGDSLAFPQQHLFQQNRPADVPSLSVDMAQRLPGALNLSAVLEPVTQPSASWTLDGAATQADAVTAIFSWYYASGDSVSRVLWYVIGPPETLSVKVPALPTTGVIGLPAIQPNPNQMRLEAVEYYDSDRQSGYRAFLAEPIRSNESLNGDDGALGFGLVRSLPAGATLRASSTFTPGT